jgi:hypothetical protein
MIDTKSYVRLFWSKVGRCKALEWTRKVRSIFSHFVRRDTSHLSRTVSGFFGQYDYNIYKTIRQ